MYSFHVWSCSKKVFIELQQSIKSSHLANTWGQKEVLLPFFLLLALLPLGNLCSTLTSIPFWSHPLISWRNLQFACLPLSSSAKKIIRVTAQVRFPIFIFVEQLRPAHPTAGVWTLELVCRIQRHEFQNGGWVIGHGFPSRRWWWWLSWWWS